MKTILIRSLLEVLRACDGVPIPEMALLCAARIHARPARPGNSDLCDALKDLESDGCACCVTDSLMRERTWTLTEKGTHKARQSR